MELIELVNKSDKLLPEWSDSIVPSPCISDKDGGEFKLMSDMMWEPLSDISDSEILSSSFTLSSSGILPEIELSFGVPDLSPSVFMILRRYFALAFWNHTYKYKHQRYSSDLVIFEHKTIYITMFRIYFKCSTYFNDNLPIGYLIWLIWQVSPR